MAFNLASEMIMNLVYSSQEKVKKDDYLNGKMVLPSLAVLLLCPDRSVELLRFLESWVLLFDVGLCPFLLHDGSDDSLECDPGFPLGREVAAAFDPPTEDVACLPLVPESFLDGLPE